MTACDCSSVSQCRNIMLFPRAGEKDTAGSNARGESLSLYLAFSDCKQAPRSWKQHVEFKMTVVNHKGPACSVSKVRSFSKT